MSRKYTFIKLFIVFLMGSYLFYGCGAYFSQPMKSKRARLGPETPQYRQLTSLPEPKDMIVAAVYKFADQTGQYKPSLSNSWSTAITQGATSILLRALEESNWFVVIERENLSNLLNERKIIRSSRAQYMGSDEGALLPPLLFAGIILEGGVISYETNILTGGIGARYFGMGASGQYREDRVTVYLRAVSTSNGKVLKTVYTTKSLLSQEVSANFFKYVSFKRLLEAETGFTYNEPTEMAVTEAIEKAVSSLVLEGIKDSLWELKNPADTALAVYKDYLEERENNVDVDQFGRHIRLDLRGQFGIGVNAGFTRYEGDYESPRLRPYYELDLDYYFAPHWALNVRGGYGEFGTYDSKYKSFFYYPEVNIKFLFLPKDKFSPFVYGGGGVMIENKKEYDISLDKYIGKVQGGGGIEYLPISSLGISLSANAGYLFNDRYDGKVIGEYNDFYWGGSLGVKYYLGKSPLLRRLEK